MPTLQFPFLRRTQVLLVLCTLLWSAPAVAQSAAAPPLLAKATTLEGAGFDPTALKGKVVMLFYWSTRCAVCRSHLPELRANMVGWRNKPFVLVTVNVDSDATEWRAYEHLVTQTQSARPVVLWSPGQVATKLPLTLVLDTNGKVFARHEGRIAPEAWDSVAEILP
ncbi:MAG: TlpA family protein disulfide reductase [Rhodoferax sp.]|nr:TlpA family protein disulfide reductase [Rhodoferax sp.]